MRPARASKHTKARGKPARVLCFRPRNPVHVQTVNELKSQKSILCRLVKPVRSVQSAAAGHKEIQIHFKPDNLFGSAGTQKYGIEFSPVSLLPANRRRIIRAKQPRGHISICVMSCDSSPQVMNMLCLNKSAVRNGGDPLHYENSILEYSNNRLDVYERFNRMPACGFNACDDLETKNTSGSSPI